ncbi:hypothetical protein A3860_29695 [Niastella vici]|uniref:DUF4296 domain-containing protein n=1 Tax=Niastella vici TaxID=1703345 RepID=A0A1V9FUU9_9BACT|nr:DUF4296 domain-containing protein [Niastella vici]OQP62125.1 hypothetical protein A3860_29695 [Niastella vici]
MNRLLLVCLSVIVCFSISCTDKDKIPKGVLPKDKMEKVLWDMIQAERFRETFIRDSSKNLKAETFKLYAQVFDIHKVSKDEFIKSYKFYMSRPDIARDMFDSLATRANRRREELYKPQTSDTAKLKMDSVAIRKADSAKVKIDSIKAAPLPAALPTPVPPPMVKPDFRHGRPPLERLKFDSLRRLRFQPKKTS